MARLDDEELRAIDCLDRLRHLLDRYGRKVGTPYFVARGKDEGGHHLRVTLLPTSSSLAAQPPVAANQPRDDLSGLIAEFRTLSDVVGAQHRQILDLINVLANMEGGELRPGNAKGNLTAAIEELRATARRSHLHIVRNEASEAGE